MLSLWQFIHMVIHKLSTGMLMAAPITGQTGGFPRPGRILRDIIKIYLIAFFAFLAKVIHSPKIVPCFTPRLLKTTCR